MGQDDRIILRCGDTNERINEYWPNAKVNWQGKLNIQQHIARVNDYDNSVFKSMINILDEKDRTVISALIMFDSPQLYHPGMSLSVAMERLGEEETDEMV